MLRKSLAVLVFGLLPLSATAQTEPVRVFVFTAETAGGFVDEDSLRRQDSVKDLKALLSKRKGIAVTESPDSAQLTLEVTVSAKVPTGSVETKANTSRDTIFGGLKTSSSTEQEVLPKISVTMRVSGTEYSTEFSEQTQAFWKDLADDVADKFEAWVKKNRAQLVR